LSISLRGATLELEGVTEVAMPVDLMHSFPLTHEQAVEILLEADWTPEEKKWLYCRSLVTLDKPVGSKLRQCWYLENRTFPLPHHYMKRFAIGDGGDMSSLIILDWLARVKKEEFRISAYVNEFRRQWLKRGIDPCTLEKIPRTS
jgi:hypothetical protein